ncbi:unannotated protein [freshwater metagenome]|uniref:Unannotated protein n=1 Tax=freshwater metagenome TaxID=449393 RepID=A0A6J7KZ03_9ZZZZ
MRSTAAASVVEPTSRASFRRRSNWYGDIRTAFEIWLRSSPASSRRAISSAWRIRDCRTPVSRASCSPWLRSAR